jgi:uncharacterized cupin superfamily protein
MRRFNLDAPELDHDSTRDGYRWRGANVARAAGAEDIAGCLYVLEEGEKTYPYHFHHGMEEWLLVVAGSPRLRSPDGERELRKGDLVCFPVGPEGAHQVTGPGTVLIVSSRSSPEVVEFPDSGKIGVLPPSLFFERDAAVSYWEGE